MPKIPGVNHLDAVRALEKAGFIVVRQGKHIVMSNGTRILTIPRHNPVNAFTLGGIVRDAGAHRWISSESYYKNARSSFFLQSIRGIQTSRFGINAMSHLNA